MEGDPRPVEAVIRRICAADTALTFHWRKRKLQDELRADAMAHVVNFLAKPGIAGALRRLPLSSAAAALFGMACKFASADVDATEIWEIIAPEAPTATVASCECLFMNAM